MDTALVHHTIKIKIKEKINEFELSLGSVKMMNGNSEQIIHVHCTVYIFSSHVRDIFYCFVMLMAFFLSFLSIDC